MENPIYTAERYRITWTGGARPSKEWPYGQALFNELLLAAPKEFARAHLLPAWLIGWRKNPQRRLTAEAHEIASMATDPRLKVEACVNGCWVMASAASEPQVTDRKEEARRLYNEDYTQAQIAQRFAVTDRQVRRWLNGK